MENESLNDANVRVNAARVSLRARLAMLEDRVTDTLETTQRTVTSTVDDASTKVRSLVDATSDRLEGALDISGCVREKPFQATGLALFAGVVAGVLSRGVKMPKIDMAETAKSVAATASTLASNPMPSGWNPIRELMDIARRELQTVGQQAIATLSKTIQDNVQSLAENAIPAITRARSENRILQANGKHSLN
jgi:ElaB/YqjD/DUF883 family membrane-anchored ribosome-binding protein